MQDLADLTLCAGADVVQLPAAPAPQSESNPFVLGLPAEVQEKVRHCLLPLPLMACVDR